jgi:hypothetical protein
MSSSLASKSGSGLKVMLIEQLLAPVGDGVRIQGEEFGHDAVAAVPQLDGFQAGGTGGIAARPADRRTTQGQPAVYREKLGE